VAGPSEYLIGRVLEIKARASHQLESRLSESPETRIEVERHGVTVSRFASANRVTIIRDYDVFNRLYAIMHDYFRLYAIILLQKLERLYAIISLSHKRRLFHLFHYDYFTYFFRNILLRLLRLYAIMCISFIASYYMHYFI
jgi:hypothetical protein